MGIVDDVFEKFTPDIIERNFFFDETDKFSIAL